MIQVKTPELPETTRLPTSASSVPASSNGLAEGKFERAIRRATSDKVRELQVKIVDDGVFVSGRCGSFYCKQQAQQAAIALMKADPRLAFDSLVNRIDVW